MNPYTARGELGTGDRDAYRHQPSHLHTVGASVIETVVDSKTVYRLTGNDPQQMKGFPEMIIEVVTLCNQTPGFMYNP